MKPRNKEGKTAAFPSWQQRAAGRLEARQDRRCEYCGETFTPKNSLGKTCSTRCRVALHRNGNGKPPLKPAKREKPLKARDVKGRDIKAIADVRKLARKFYREKLRPHVMRLKRLRRCDRSTYDPSMLTEVGEAIERETKELFKILGGEDAISDEQGGP